MLKAVRDVVTLAAGRHREDLATDMPMRRAMINAIQEIGEAAARVSAITRSRIEMIPWPMIVGMRNRLVHGYDEVDFDMVWKVAMEEAPALKVQLEAALANWRPPTIDESR